MNHYQKYNESRHQLNSQEDPDFQYDGYVDKQIQTSQNQSQQLIVEEMFNSVLGEKKKPHDEQIKYQEKIEEKIDGEPKTPEKSSGHKIQRPVRINSKSNNDFEQESVALNQSSLSKKEQPSRIMSSNNQLRSQEVSMSKNDSIDLSPKKEQSQLVREKLAEQNKHLKEQILELAQCLDDIVDRERLKKPKKYGINPDKDDDSEIIKKQKQVIKEQLIEIEKLKVSVKAANRQLETNFDNQRITNKEDELRNLQKQLDAQLSELKSLKTIQKNQVHALSTLNNDEENNKKKDFLQNQLKEMKKKNRELTASLMESESKLKDQHQIHFQKQNKIKQIDEKIAEQKKKTKSQMKLITEEECEILENRLTELTEDNNTIQKQFKEQIKNLEKDKRDIWKLAEKKEIQLKEKEKELKINQLRFKEMARLVRHNALQPINKAGDSTKLLIAQSDESIEKLQNVFQLERFEN